LSRNLANLLTIVTRIEPSQERSRRRRDALLRAAIELLAEGGVKAVTHRAVAKRAGVAVAATTYYFDSIQQLTEDALRLHVRERVAELRSITEQAAEGGRSVEAIALRFADALIGRQRELLIAQYEVYLEAARTPALRPTVADALEDFRALAEASLAALGAARPVEGAVAFIALIDGFSLHRMARPLDANTDANALFEAMSALFIAYAMDSTELSVWQARFRADLATAQLQ
jgi:TetR/AcrR family transcriptional regulator, regulator of biofilm formation and stress response